MSARPPPTPEQLAWLAGTPERGDLLRMADVIMRVTNVQTDIAIASVKGDPVDRDVALEAIEAGNKAAAMIRELLNAGVDPEWDHREGN